MYFGYRYYDPQLGRWISPDPLGTVDGPNLYAYARNNPMKYVDYFGLNSLLDENCGCTQHGHPGWHNAPEGCVCICGRNTNAYATGSYRSKIGSDINSAICGVSHGVVDFVLGSIHDLQTAASYIGSLDLDIHLQERSQIIKAIEQSQTNQMNTIEGSIMDTLSIDKSDSVYHFFRSRTTTGLEIWSLIAGGYGAVKGVMAFNKLAKAPLQISKLSRKSIAVGRGAENINAGISLTTKLRQLETIQQTAAKTRILPDGRIRYYKAERMATYPGRTRGSAYVTEYNPTTGQVRGWNECYDQFGNVNRVHLKDINGQSLTSPHYPLIAQEMVP